MAASRQDIERWFKDGVKEGMSHLIVARDTFDHSNYPVYILPGESVEKKVRELRNQSMTTVDEVYSLSMDMETQLNQFRAFNY